ncbi:hypothetical protein [Micromonospora profundi]|uniref:hypothetical protein n=1 Tax=Micromonospora profundi TaxID=1420889 RepID=UPI0036674F67
MSMSAFKPATGRRGFGSIAAVVAVVLVALASAFASGRASAPQEVTAEEYAGRLRQGVPVGFPATPRGAGDAAAAYLTSLAAAMALPAGERQAVVELIASPGSASAVADIVGVASEQGSALVISQVVVARVWAPNDDLGAVVPDGGEVPVRVLLCALSGAATNGIVAGPEAGLAGGWYVQSITVRWEQGRWRVSAAQRSTPVPPPDTRGTQRDGGPRDTQPMLEVLSAQSWVPGTV